MNWEGFGALQGSMEEIKNGYPLRGVKTGLCDEVLYEKRGWGVWGFVDILMM